MRADAASLLTIWYDGGCPLCTREVALMRRLDRRGNLRFLDLGDVGTSCPLDRQIMLQRFHARDSDGRLYDGAAAFAAMWRAVPLLRPLGRVAQLPGMMWVIERLYRAFLRIRPRLQSVVGKIQKRGTAEEQR